MFMVRFKTVVWSFVTCFYLINTWYHHYLQIGQQFSPRLISKRILMKCFMNKMPKYHKCTQSNQLFYGLKLLLFRVDNFIFMLLLPPPFFFLAVMRVCYSIAYPGIEECTVLPIGFVVI